MRTLLRRLCYLLRLSRADNDLAEELDFHREMKERELARHGMPMPEVAFAARRALGSAALARDRSRDVWVGPWLEGLVHDFRFTLRGLRRDRAFTLAAISMLAVAIGLNGTVFTVMEAMLFRGFPHVQRNDRLLYLQERSPSGLCCLSYADFEDWRTQSQTFQAIAFVASNRPVTFRDGAGRPLDKLTFRVSANTFALLGVAPLLGRDFVPNDEAPGAAQVVMLNHRFWESRYARRPEIIGSTVQINGAPATIIGVMPSSFDFPTQEDLWMPVTRSPELLQRGITPGGFMAVGRLRDAVTPQQARAELETINRRLQASYPASNRGVGPTAATHSETMSGGHATMIWGSLFVGACFVLLIACANLANLALVRTMARWREYSTRIALGAGPARTSRQIVMESLTIAAVAGALGWWFTRWSMRWWTITTASRYQVLDYAMDSRTLAYLIAISGIAALSMSLAPIVRVVQLDVNGALRVDGRGMTQRRSGKQWAAGLITGQMALAFVLLSGAGVLMRSFVNIVGADTGVRDPERVMVGLLRLPSEKYSTAELRHAYFSRLEEQLKSIPGVEAATMATVLPVSYAFLRPLAIDGRPSPPEGEASVGFVRVGSAYFDVVGTPVRRGRGFNVADRASALPVAIVNESFAATFLPGEQVVGQRIRALAQGPAGVWRTVVGVVPNILQGEPLRQQFKPLVYVPFAQEPAPRVGFFLLRMAVPRDQVAQTVRAEVQRLDPDAGVEEVETLQASFAFDRDFMDAEHSELGKHATLAPAFALIALFLAAIGLYAVIAHSVSQRTKEIGVRIAVGAASDDIRRLIFREGMRPVALGWIVGLLASLAANRILQSQLVGVSPYDPVTLAAAPVVLFLVALVACDIPSRRALRINPVIALQHE
jgi:putative ABC transport system permease protein